MIRDPGRELLARRRAAAERVRREVQRADGTLSHPYFREFRRHLESHRGAATLDRVFASCAAARVALVGDFHASPSHQAFAARLLTEVARRRGRVGLGIEFVYTRQQAWLDDRQAGLLDDREFLRRIHYREEWGYPWSGFAVLLDTARRLDVPVFALDVSPRAGMHGVRRRDDHAARRIASVLRRERGMGLVVLFGESHLAPGHLPARTAARLAHARVGGRVVSVFQNPDELYWRQVAPRDRPPRAVRLEGDSWAVFHGSPLAKYEAYRQILERWSDDRPGDDEADLTPAVHHLVHVLLGWLGIRATRRVRHRAGWEGDLVDAFPEVYSGADAADLLPTILREHGRSRAEIREARALLGDRGALYESRSNAVFLSRYLPGRAAGEGARFLRTALTGRLWVAPAATAPDPAARAYGAAYNEALAYLGSRLVDPASDYLSGDELAVVRSRPGKERDALSSRSAWIEAHRRFEARGGVRPPPEILDPLRADRRTARVLARDLGHRLGRVLYERVRAGRVERSTLRSWFTRPVPPRRAPGVVLELLRGG